MRRLKPFINPGIILLLLAALAGLTWANYRVTSGEKGGNDFAIYWSSARTLLFDGATPYGELASLRSQNLIYGLGGRPGDPPSRLDLPLHIETLILPFGLISNFQMARAIWMSVLEIALMVSIFICLRTFRWSPNPIVGAEIIFFALCSVYGLWALILGNAIILAGLLIAAALLALRDKQEELAGILLALTTFKFMTVGFFLIFILLWAAVQRRWRIFIPFIMTVLIMVLISFFFIPNWFVPYVQAIVVNLKYGGWLTPSLVFKDGFPYVGERLGWVMSGFLAIVLMVEWWLARKKEFQPMAWTAALTLAVTPLLGLPAYPQNHILLIIPLIFVFSIIASRWTDSSSLIISGIIILLFVLLWIPVLLPMNKATVLYFPLPVFTIVLLYWIRWWATISPHTKSDPFMNSL